MRVPFNIPRPDARRFDVIGFGENSVDLVAVAAEYPETNTKQRLRGYAQLPGGAVATAMVACARLGWQSGYVGSFGTDELGAFIRRCLTEEGVDLSAARIVPDTTNRFAIVIVDAHSGNRTVLWDRPSALGIAAADVPPDAVTSGRMLLVDSEDMAAATQAARLARDAGIPTVVDVDRVQPGTADLLRHIDAVIAAESFPAELTGCADLGRAIQIIAREFQAPLVVVTLGAGGSLATCDGREIRTAGCPVECVDSTGAGDAFRGGFISGCLRLPGAPIEDMLLYANAVAALNCRALGAMTALPRALEVDRMLQTRSHM